MESGAGHHYTSDSHRLKLRHRGCRPSSADLHHDVFDDGHGLFCRILERNGEAGGAIVPAEAFLVGEGVDLEYDAVDGYWEVGAIRTTSS